MKSFLGRSRRSGLQRESPQDACPLGSSKRRRARTCVSLPAAGHTGYTRAKVHACVPLLKHKWDSHSPALESTVPVAQKAAFQGTRPLSTGQDCAAIAVRGRALGLHSSPPPPPGTAQVCRRPGRQPAELPGVGPGWVSTLEVRGCHAGSSRSNLQNGRNAPVSADVLSWTPSFRK